MLASKTEKDALSAVLFFNIAHYVFRPWPWILVALCSLIVYPELSDIQRAFPNLEPRLLGHDIAYPAMDSSPSGATTWVLEGEAYRGANGFSDRPDGDIAGGNLVGRWNRTFSDSSAFQGQFFYDGTYRQVPRQFTEHRHTFDLDAQQRIKTGRHASPRDAIESGQRQRP